MFETKMDVLEWYEKQPRTLTSEFVNTINWREARAYPLDKRFIPVLLYMRDVEVLTEMYYQEMMQTPTGKDPVVKRFMQRWREEEITHGELIDRFLNEIGFQTPKDWKIKTRNSVPKSYTTTTRILTALTNIFGKNFVATHMTFGAINEMSTAQGYRKLMETAKHPVLTQIIKGIIREESIHTKFYFSVARLELQRSKFSRQLARFVVENFWQPVGQGAKPARETHYVIKTLFNDKQAMNWIDRNISSKIRLLPGFENSNKINLTIEKILLEG
ncbi:MAG: ferritin-like domain-containing protein [Pyrinomonadaceae bacterium]|nr:ferritin-like domain-containing protein [Pyrinomonadaceae bacterium]MCX7640271.1 ferritin-like domain-containing protein [Pyrinomonadaceae bacterium]MDW8305281.1 ferritin-like domain-containing protein [Acidobacteriota bacterium]